MNNPFPTQFRIVLVVLVMMLLFVGQPIAAQDSGRTYLPMITGRGDIEVTQGLNRAQAMELYNSHYLPQTTVSYGWTGNMSSCDAGALSGAYLDAALKVVNYYRIAAGLPSVALKSDWMRPAQAAALTMVANEGLSHFPPDDWLCLNDDARFGAEWSALAAYWDEDRNIMGIGRMIEDPGSSNTAVGHRRSVLEPRKTEIGLGAVPAGDRLFSVGVFLHHQTDVGRPWPQTREPYVAWPPPGYVPHQAIFPYAGCPNCWVENDLRWSILAQNGGYRNPTVEMTLDGRALPLEIIEHRYYPQRNEGLLVWVPDVSHEVLTDGRDHVLEVRVTSTPSGGASTVTTYTVVVFDAGSP